MTLVESLDKICANYKMEISGGKTKLLTNSANSIQREMKVKGQKLGTVMISMIILKHWIALKSILRQWIALKSSLRQCITL